jgi:hypothetical protein
MIDNIELDKKQKQFFNSKPSSEMKLLLEPEG